MGSPGAVDLALGRPSFHHSACDQQSEYVWILRMTLQTDQEWAPFVMVITERFSFAKMLQEQIFDHERKKVNFLLPR